MSQATSTRTVERALNLLADVCAHDSSTLSECARRAHLAPSTALRLLRTLETTGFVRRDEQQGYRAGTRIIQLGAQALGRQSLVTLAEPGMRRIVDATGESTYLGIAAGGDTAIYIAMAEGTHTVRHSSWVGRAVPLDGLPIGRVFAGQTPASGYVAQRDRTEPDVTAIVAPIARPGGIAGVLSLLGPTYRIDDDTMHAYGEIVRREARAVAELLGVHSSPDTAVPVASGTTDHLSEEVTGR